VELVEALDGKLEVGVQAVIVQMYLDKLLVVEQVLNLVCHYHLQQVTQ
jgi:hypothetical protein